MEDTGHLLDVADEAITKVLRCIRPTLDSEEKRKDIIDYIRRLVRTVFGLEVFTYGSVLLKTYLPDGDIDLTVIHNPAVKNTLPNAMHAVLLAEEQNGNTRFKVKSVLFIDAAEVKIIKCIVQNVAVDISFNQLGGLSTLCFLEKIDRVVGRNHLFKRSFILVKAWCFHESRILGAHNGLISTYALEVLVLYIFHMYNKALNKPLEVLYRFLDYFSNFDWDLYGVSLKGPILRSALPNIVVDKPVNWENDFLLNEPFVRDCMDFFTVTSKLLDVNLKPFPLKFLNIVDPLKETNNIGRSVNKGNFERIRGALKLGAKRLGLTLLSPSDEVAHGLKKFFSNTIRRHGHRLCTDGNLGSSQLIESDGVSATDLDFRNPLTDLTGDFDNQIRNLLWARKSIENSMHPPLEWVPPIPHHVPSLGMIVQSFRYPQPFYPRMINTSNSKGGTQPFYPRQNVPSYTRGKPQWRDKRLNNKACVPVERRYEELNPNGSHVEGASFNITFPTAPTLKNKSSEEENSSVTFPTAPTLQNKSLEGASSNITFPTAPTLKNKSSEEENYSVTFPTSPALQNKSLEGASSNITFPTVLTLTNKSPEGENFSIAFPTAPTFKNKSLEGSSSSITFPTVPTLNKGLEGASSNITFLTAPTLKNKSSEGASSSVTFPSAPTLNNKSLEGSSSKITFPTAPTLNKGLEGASSNITFLTAPTLKNKSSEGASSSVTFPTAPTLKNKSLEGSSSSITFPTAPTLDKGLEGASSNITFPTAPTLKNKSTEGASSSITFPTEPTLKNKRSEGASSNVTFPTVPTLQNESLEGASSNVIFPTAPTLKNKSSERAISNVTLPTMPVLKNKSPVLNTTRRPLPRETEGSNSRVPFCNNIPNREMGRPFFLKKEDFPPLTN